MNQQSMVESGFEILGVDGDDADLWRKHFARLPTPDINFSVEYAQAIQDTSGPDDPQVQLAVFADASSFVMKPFVLRRVDLLPFMKLWPDSGPLYDIASLYPFGGPLAGPDVDHRLVEGLDQAFARYCAGSQVAAEFTVFHPLLANERLVPHLPSELRARKDTVWIDLEQDADAILRGMKRDHRRGVSVARREGVTTEPRAPDDASIAAFEALYLETMNRVNADARWFFPSAYFKNLAMRLGPERMTFFAAILGGETVALALVLRDEETAYYHLAGSLRSARRAYPNDLLVYDLALWAKALGCKRLFLGGGVTARDGVFDFKAGFSRSRAPLHTFERKHDDRLYRRLCALRDEWDDRNGTLSTDPDFFPAYRRPVQPRPSDLA